MPYLYYSNIKYFKTMEEERVRYGDADLAEFKQIILKKLEQAKEIGRASCRERV